MACENILSNGPFIQILEQPGDHHYRYKTEQFHGYIMAKDSPSAKRRKDMLKFPTVKVLNCHQDVVVRCWLISTNLNDRPNATFHQLAMKKPKTEIIKLEPLDFSASERNDYTVTLDYLYIIHAVMDDPNDVNFYEKKKAWLEKGTFHCPGYDIISQSKKEYFQSIDKDESLLYFEVFDAHTYKKLCEAVSSKIKNKNKYRTLKIVNYSRPYGSCKGGDEVLIFVERVSEDVKVRFFELKKDSNCERNWEALADFGPQHIHHKYGIAFRTPPFHDTSIKKDVNVFFELYRTADGAISDPVMFTYKPDESCKLHDFFRKRSHSPESTCIDYGNVLSSQCQCPKKKMREESIRPDTTYVLNDQPENVINICDEALGNEPWKSIIDIECEAEGTMNILEQVVREPVNPITQEELFDVSYIESLLQNDGLKTDGIDKPKKEMKIDKELRKVHFAEGTIFKNEIPIEISSEEVSSSITEVEEDPGTTLPELKEMVKLVRSKKKTIIDFLNLLENVRDINAVDFYGNSIFLFASEYSTEILEALLSRKDLDRTLKNLEGDNALLCATRSGCPSLVECLLAHDFDPNVQNYKSGETPLHIAVGYEVVPLVEVLLKYGADPLIDNYGSQSAYDYSNDCVKEDLKKIIYEKAQEQFSKRYPKFNGELSIEHHNNFDDFDRDLERKLQHLRVSSP